MRGRRRVPDPIVVLVPVYKRPHRVSALIHSVRNSYPENAELLFIASPEDREQRDALEEHTDLYLVMPGNRTRGDWARKINYGYKHTDHPWMLLAADDIHFRPGWDTCLRRAAGRSGKHVLGTADLNPHANPDGIYSPHPLVSREYADQQGTVDRKKLVVSEAYDHNYPDRELSATAIARGEWLFVPDAVIEHLHPGWTNTPNDDTYRLGALHGDRDYRLHQKRSRLWIKEQRIRERRERLANHPR
jgi:glycosyltransferase involved in cell wall biosynthesis